jgi:hypothetical protein
MYGHDTPALPPGRATQHATADGHVYCHPDGRLVMFGPDDGWVAARDPVDLREWR